MFYVPVVGWDVHKYILLKSLIVLSSWLLAYFGMKHIPLTIYGPINATRPILVLVGALLLLGEQSIREVIAFPKNQNAQCLVSEAPAPVDKAQLDELGISAE